MPAGLPSVDDLPLRWSPADAETVLAALDRSGLTQTEFSRRTGIQVQRLRRWRAREPGAGVVRLVEMVARAAPSGEPSVEVVSPGGWRLLVPGALLGELVDALSGDRC